MRLFAAVQVTNRKLHLLNISSKRPEKSCLTLGYMPGSRSISILLQSTKNYAGVRYKVNGNVLNICSSCRNEGKITIQFKDPPVDIRINGQKQDVLRFLSLLKETLNDTINPSDLSNLTAATPKIPNRPGKLVIKGKQDIQKFNEISRDLETIVINNVHLTTLNGRIFRLQHLKVLNLEDNCLEIIPEQIDLLPNLKALHLGRNKLGKGQNWMWLNSSTIKSNLVYLDLNSNKLRFLPQNICKLKSLEYLNVNNNDLTKLPSGLGHLSKLQHLYLSNNKCEWLPGSMQLLQLNVLDITENPSRSIGLNTEINTYTDRTLLEMASCVVLENRLAFTEETLPREVIDHLYNAGYCICKKPSYPNEPPQCFSLLQYNVCKTHIFSTPLPLAITFCSNKCLKIVSNI